jgi:hypothetical protein
MPEIPPPSSGFSDPQVAAILEQNKARRRRAVGIFVAVALVLGVGLGSSALYFSTQAKKKRNVAYSRVVKCLFGKPLAPGEPPMTRVRAAWRARILAEPTKHGADTMEDQEAQKAKMWPNRCVPQLMAFTDTLKEVGEMKEGEKDLGYYSRDLSKQTAGDNWKKVDTYQAAVEAFVSEAEKGHFEFVDVPDVQAPDLLDAKPIDDVFPRSTALADTRIQPYAHTVFTSQTARFFVAAGKGKPARLCVTGDGKQLACNGLDALPPEASGVPWMLSAGDGAAPMLAFGRDGGIVDARSVATGVWRAGEAASILPSDAYYVVGGFTESDGAAALLLKDQREPLGDKFEIGRAAPGAAKIDVEKVALTDWNELASSVAMAGPYVLWVTSKDELQARPAFAKDAKVATIATLPGPVHASWSMPAFAACATKHGTMIAVRVRADRLDRMLVVSAGDSGFGKPQVTDDGDLACTDDAAVIVTDDAVTTCTDAGCKADKTEKPSNIEERMAIDGTLVKVSSPAGLLRIEWSKGGKPIATKLYDAQMKGTVLLGESKLGHVSILPRRGYGLIVADVGGTQHVARIDGQGGVTPTTFKP